MVVAIIPARGGSTGIPGKNLAAVGGVPLITRAVAAARAADLIDAVYVSTDDQGIAAAARAAGAVVIARPRELSGDSVSSEAAILHAIGVLPFTPELVVFIQATSPFIASADLDSAIARVVEDECDMVFSAKRTHAFLWRHTDAGAAGVNHDAAFRPRRQDLEPQFQETGAFYVMRSPGFLKARHRFFGRIGIAEVADLTAVDIDSTDDLALARLLAPMLDRPGPLDVDLVVTDFDGVHTDDRVHLSAEGTEFVSASRADGMGVSLLRRAGIGFLIISSETNPVVAARASKLMVEAVQSVDDKAAALTRWSDGQDIDFSRVAYMGNDVNDLGCMAMVGWPVAVADAHPLVLAAARVVLTAKGGRGAIRELADRILDSPATADTTQEEIWSRSRPRS